MCSPSIEAACAGDDADTLGPETSFSTVKNVAPPWVAETDQRVLSEREIVPSAANGGSHPTCKRRGACTLLCGRSWLQSCGGPGLSERCLSSLSASASPKIDLSSVRPHPL